MDESSKGRKPRLALRGWREADQTAPADEYSPQGRVIVPFLVIAKASPESDVRILVLVPATD
jgi:hypothetical protein